MGTCREGFEAMDDDRKQCGNCQWFVQGSAKSKDLKAGLCTHPKMVPVFRQKQGHCYTSEISKNCHYWQVKLVGVIPKYYSGVVTEHIEGVH